MFCVKYKEYPRFKCERTGYYFPLVQRSPYRRYISNVRQACVEVWSKYGLTRERFARGICHSNCDKDHFYKVMQSLSGYNGTGKVKKEGDKYYWTGKDRMWLSPAQYTAIRERASNKSILSDYDFP